MSNNLWHEKYFMQARKLDVFFEMEEKMITKSSLVSSYCCPAIDYTICS